MMKMSHNLIVIENGELRTYILDDKRLWEVGRPSKGNIPDIKLHSSTVSRKHGKFQNMDGIWFYVDYNGKNGTVYNNKKITMGLHGRVKPIMLADGDIFVFGGGEETVINSKTVWALFTSGNFGDEWSVVDTKGYQELCFTTEEKTICLEHPAKGEVIAEADDLAIYMGDLTYLFGKIKLVKGNNNAGIGSGIY